MSDKENEFDVLDNLDQSNTVSEDDFSEYEEAIDELNEDEEVDTLEEVESDDGELVEFDEEDGNDDSDEPTKKSGSKARLAILSIVGIVGVAGVVTLVGTNLGLIGSSHKTAIHRPVHKETTKEKPKETKEVNPISFDEAKPSLASESDSKEQGLKVDSSKEEGLKLDLDLSDDVEAKTVKKSPTVDPVEKSAEIKPENQPENNSAISFVDDDVEESKSSSDIDSKELSKILSRLEVLENISTKLSKESQKGSDRFDIVVSKLNRLTDISREAKDATVVEVEKELPRLSDSEKNALIKGRTRLAGYSVIATSSDGEMSIIRSLKYGKERVSVFFKGEKIIVAGEGVMTISDIKDSGHLALIGNKYYMDDTYIPFAEPKKSKPKAKKVEKKEVKKPTSKPKDEKTVVAEKVEKPTKFKEETFREIAKGWKMNGVYTDSFLIESPTGDWSTRVVGDKIPGLGIVQGLDSNGNLIVGKHIIQLYNLPE